MCLSALLASRQRLSSSRHSSRGCSRFRSSCTRWHASEREQGRGWWWRHPCACAVRRVIRFGELPTRGPSQWVAEKCSVKAPLPLGQPLKLPWAGTFNVVPFRVGATLEKASTAAGQLEKPGRRTAVPAVEEG